MNLNGCLNWGFVAFWSFNNLTSSRISSGGSGLALSDVNVVQGIDSLACLLDVNGNGIGDELVDSLLQVHRCNLTGNDVYHLLANLANLLRLGVAVFLGAARLLLCETNAKDTNEVSISGLDIDMGFNQSLPLLNHGSKFISGQVHTIELGQTALALNFFAQKLEFSVGPFGILFVLQIGEGDFIDTSLKTIRGQ